MSSMKLTILAIVMVLLFGVMMIMLKVTNSDSEELTNIQTTAKETEISKEASIDPISSGSITGAMYAAPSGIFNPLFYEDAYDANILAFTHEGLFKQNNRLEFIPNLAEDWEMNEDQTELTIHLRKNITWHDGEAFTAQDVVFTYKTLADSEYIKAGGIHTAYVEPLLSYEEYAKGETDEFLGVVASDSFTVIFTFTEPTYNPLFYASSSIIPEHIFKDIAIEDMADAPESKEPGKVIGTGPFQLTDMVEKEQYTLKHHENYWQGTPYLDEITWKVIAKSVISSLLESGMIDFVANPNGVPIKRKVTNLENINLVEQPDFNYLYVGFKHHYRPEEDVEKGVMNPDNWIANEKLIHQQVRQAIAYAINREQIINESQYDQATIVDTPIAKQSWAYDKDGTDYAYDPEKAMKILDELEMIDVNDDGFREDSEGSEWILNLDYPNDTQYEEIAKNIEQMLKEVGINVNRREPKDITEYIEMLMNDDHTIDLFLFEWGLSHLDPDISSFVWETKSAYNFSRWNNPESDSLLEEATTLPEAFEQEYRRDIYQNWQSLFKEDLPAYILFSPNMIWAYNNRLQGMDPLPHTMYNNVHLWRVNESD